MNNEQHDTSTTRVKLPRKVSEPIYLKLEDLESIQEITQARQRAERPPAA